MIGGQSSSSRTSNSSSSLLLFGQMGRWIDDRNNEKRAGKVQSLENIDICFFCPFGHHNANQIYVTCCFPKTSCWESEHNNNNNFCCNFQPKRPSRPFLNPFKHACSCPVAPLIPVHHCCCENPTRLPLMPWQQDSRPLLRTERCWETHLRLFCENRQQKGKKKTFWAD